MAGIYDGFEIEKGSTFTSELNWTDAQGNLVPLTGYTATMVIQYQNYSGATAISLTTENGGLAINTIDNTITPLITDEQTALLTAGPCVYKLRLIKNGAVTTLLKGTLNIVY